MCKVHLERWCYVGKPDHAQWDPGPTPEPSSVALGALPLPLRWEVAYGIDQARRRPNPPAMRLYSLQSAIDALGETDMCSLLEHDEDQWPSYGRVRHGRMPTEKYLLKSASSPSSLMNWIGCEANTDTNLSMRATRGGCDDWESAELTRASGWTSAASHSPGCAARYPEDSPKEIKLAPRGLSPTVMAQIENPDNLVKLTDPGWRLLFPLLIETGLRINDALYLPQDCLVRDTENAPYLRYMNRKMKHEALVPISSEMADAIAQQAARVRSRYSAQAGKASDGVWGVVCDI